MKFAAIDEHAISFFVKINVPAINFFMSLKLQNQCMLLMVNMQRRIFFVEHQVFTNNFNP